ncbi:histidine kinase [Helicobacter cinaedi]|uniref:ATP-binding protein n=1 Tax=Helicobacter cinaedi TaxID=213 RepID=UPI000CF16BF6|nr:ATP-binding protein [Helicobacter cinaedi]AWK61283.1 histidine kinase [Helicobacter cinaedi]QOQ96316.1 histidine kinase [Helicobacter cinaedi]
MKKKIFYAIFLGILSVQILSVLSVAFILDNLIKSQSFERLHYTLRHLNTDDIQEILSQRENILPAPYRITLISTQGQVLYDSKAQVESMDNHLWRQEVQDVLTQFSNHANKPIFTQRESATLNEQTLYVATMMSVDSQNIIVRLSEQKKALSLVLFDFLPYLCVLLLFGLALSGILASILSKKIIKPIENINLSSPIQTNPYPELQIFMQRIAKQKKKIKKQLRIINARQHEIETIIQNMNEGFLLLDSELYIKSCNPIALEYLQIDSIDTLFESPHLATLQAELQNIMNKPQNNTEGSDCSFECEIKGRTLYVIALPVWVKTQLQAIAMVLIDKSSQKQAQDFRKEFSANVTHELKTPLAIILASSEMLKSGLVKKEDEAEFLTKIYTESNRLLTLIDKILRLSFFDENTIELEKSPLDLGEILKRVSKNLKSLADEKGIEIVISTNGRESKIWGISSLIEDMIYNLVENAIKYSNEKSQITLLLSQNAQGVSVCVKDSGIGIPLEEQERVFERFYCVDKSRSKKLGGSGLGLSIVKHIAKIHNAKIELKSQLGVGTSIRVEFPKTR